MAISLFNADLEKQFLSGTILHPDTRALTVRVKPVDLSQTNQVILKAIDAILAGDAKFSAPLLVSTLVSLGHAKIGNALDAGLYIKSLEGLSVAEKAVEGLAKEIYRLTVRRKMHATGLRVAAAAEKGAELKATEIVAEATQIFNEQVNVLGGADEEPEDLFGTVGEFLRTESIYDRRSVRLPFDTMHDLWGSLDIGCTVVCSRMKVGKSTFSLSTLQQLAAQDTDDSFRALILDTELTKAENQSRAISAASGGVKEYLIRHKLYRKNPVMVKQVEKAEALLAPLAGRVSHKYIGGMEMDQILTIARRWAAKTLKGGKRGLIVFDYLKLGSGSEFSGKMPLHITIGGKMEALKNLSKELEIPLLMFCQANRSGEDTKEGGRMQNSSVIGGSDMIAQFASNCYLLERLSPEERMELDPAQVLQFTHRLTAIATRVLGPDNMGKNRLVKYQSINPSTKKSQTRYIDNAVLLNFDSFNVRECVGAPTLFDLVERQRTTGVPVQAASATAPQRPLL